MKKHIFLLCSFMSGSLITANSLLVISCAKKTSVKGNKDDEKDTTEQVEFKIAAKLKNEIRNIIDDVITNSNDKSVDWVINLADQSLNNHQKIIKCLNETVESLKKMRRETNK